MNTFLIINIRAQTAPLAGISATIFGGHADCDLKAPDTPKRLPRALDELYNKNHPRPMNSFDGMSIRAQTRRSPALRRRAHVELELP